MSQLAALPPSWIPHLQARGVYLLACPRSGELYVGAAHGAEGFWGRWQDYAQNGHGGNVLLRDRDPSDYCISILETMGSSTTEDDVFNAEALWKRKLRAGLNGN